MSQSKQHVATFQERGVAVPFTTPLLGGTRARSGSVHRLELILRNPSGASGVYVMPWAGIKSLCRPTLHDRVLNDRINALPRVTPNTIRRVAREIAAEGLAGEQAMEAARGSIATDSSDRRITNYRLLVSLIRQVNVAPESATAALAIGTADLDLRARQTIVWLAPRLGQPITWAVGALDEIADIMAGIGVSADNEEGRIPRLIKLVGATHDEIVEWRGFNGNAAAAACAQLIGSTAKLTLSLARTALADARLATRDMAGLLRLWAVDGNAVTRLAELPEWLLDGWEQICLIWQFARDDASRAVALVEISGILPMLPGEANGGHLFDLENLFAVRRAVALNEDWRTGATVFGLIARNEHFRALAA